VRLELLPTLVTDVKRLLYGFRQFQQWRMQRLLSVQNH